MQDRRLAGVTSTLYRGQERSATHVSRLQVGEGGSLGAALDHCMYAGGALARVGLDFRAALPPLFEGRILQLFTQVRRHREKT